MKSTAIFKTPGDSITIGSQRFHAGNITPEIVKALIDLDPKNAEHFNLVEAEDDKSVTADQEETPAAEGAVSKKRTTARQPE